MFLGQDPKFGRAAKYLRALANCACAEGAAAEPLVWMATHGFRTTYLVPQDELRQVKLLQQ